MPTKYIGITIGPVYDTISLTSSPAGLWAASYMFSHISRRLCELIVKRTLVESECDIVSPYYCEAEQIFDGIGRFHDRIIFKPKDAQAAIGEMQNLFDQIAVELADVFGGNSVEWFKQYLQLHALCFESHGNPITDSSQYLDAIELEKTYPSGDVSSPLAAIFDSSDKNTLIREIIRNRLSYGEWPFSIPGYNDGENERLPDMEYITGRFAEKKRQRMKINSYYAIVQSDGDKIGEYINSCKERKENERDFSKRCLTYCSVVASRIKEYGGVPIYAGGDDLLFIAPLESPKIEGENLLTLLESLNFEFSNYFGKGEGAPTLSFGIAIRYYKYPLYEAFAEAGSLLFDQAKANRDAAAISLKKHSGQSIGFVLERFSDSGERTIAKRIGAMLAGRESDDFLKSVSVKIWQFQSLFRQAVANDNIEERSRLLANIFKNTFDSDIHNKYEAELAETKSLLEEICSKISINGSNGNKKEVPPIRDIGLQIGLEEMKKKPEQLEDAKAKEELQPLYALDALLRFVKFFYETGEEESE